jgi:hypothetical protein
VIADPPVTKAGVLDLRRQGQAREPAPARSRAETEALALRLARARYEPPTLLARLWSTLAVWQRRR